MNMFGNVLRAGALVLLAANVALAQQNQMTFFATSAGSGMGANLGGLAGADKHCQTLGKGGRCRQPAPGVPTSARKARAPSMRGIESGRDRGEMRRGRSSRRTLTNSTAPRPI